MYKKLLLIILISTVWISCKTAEKQNDILHIAKQYYRALDTSDTAMMSEILTDSLRTVELDYNYVQTFSKQEYVNDWLPWDALFEPNYKIIDISQEGETVKATVSKIDHRIQLLHEGPTSWSSVIRFDGDKIASIERTNLVFNDTVWVKNRTKLINWIDLHHPELNGFLNGQTVTIGKQYLKAIELYNNKE